MYGGITGVIAKKLQKKLQRESENDEPVTYRTLPEWQAAFPSLTDQELCSILHEPFASLNNVASVCGHNFCRECFNGLEGSSQGEGSQGAQTTSLQCPACTRPSDFFRPSFTRQSRPLTVDPDRIPTADQTCDMCHKPLDPPKIATTRCGHHYCAKHFDRWKKQKQDEGMEVQCPVCRRVLYEAPPPPEFQNPQDGEFNIRENNIFVLFQTLANPHGLMAPNTDPTTNPNLNPESTRYQRVRYNAWQGARRAGLYALQGAGIVFVIVPIVIMKLFDGSHPDVASEMLGKYFRFIFTAVSWPFKAVGRGIKRWFSGKKDESERESSGSGTSADGSGNANRGNTGSNSNGDASSTNRDSTSYTGSIGQDGRSVKAGSGFMKFGETTGETTTEETATETGDLKTGRNNFLASFWNRNADSDDSATSSPDSPTHTPWWKNFGRWHGNSDSDATGPMDSERKLSSGPDSSRNSKISSRSNNTGKSFSKKSNTWMWAFALIIPAGIFFIILGFVHGRCKSRKSGYANTNNANGGNLPVVGAPGNMGPGSTMPGQPGGPGSTLPGTPVPVYQQTASRWIHNGRLMTRQQFVDQMNEQQTGEEINYPRNSMVVQGDVKRDSVGADSVGASEGDTHDRTISRDDTHGDLTHDRTISRDDTHDDLIGHDFSSNYDSHYNSRLPGLSRYFGGNNYYVNSSLHESPELGGPEIEEGLVQAAERTAEITEASSPDTIHLTPTVSVDDFGTSDPVTRTVTRSDTLNMLDDDHNCMTHDAGITQTLANHNFINLYDVSGLSPPAIPPLANGARDNTKPEETTGTAGNQRV